MSFASGASPICGAASATPHAASATSAANAAACDERCNLLAAILGKSTAAQRTLRNLSPIAVAVVPALFLLAAKAGEEIEFLALRQGLGVHLPTIRCWRRGSGRRLRHLCSATTRRPAAPALSPPLRRLLRPWPPWAGSPSPGRSRLGLRRARRCGAWPRRLGRGGRARGFARRGGGLLRRSPGGRGRGRAVRRAARRGRRRRGLIAWRRRRRRFLGRGWLNRSDRFLVLATEQAIAEIAAADEHDHDRDGGDDQPEPAGGRRCRGGDGAAAAGATAAGRGTLGAGCAGVGARGGAWRRCRCRRRPGTCRWLRPVALRWRSARPRSAHKTSRPAGFHSHKRCTSSTVPPSWIGSGSRCARCFRRVWVQAAGGPASAKRSCLQGGRYYLLIVARLSLRRRCSSTLSATGNTRSPSRRPHWMPP